MPSKTAMRPSWPASRYAFRPVRTVNPYRDLRALLDVTRPLAPEEMAELQLEQGYVERALRIYDELAARDPANASYATRRAWLARMVPVAAPDPPTGGALPSEVRTLRIIDVA